MLSPLVSFLCRIKSCPLSGPESRHHLQNVKAYRKSFFRLLMSGCPCCGFPTSQASSRFFFLLSHWWYGGETVSKNLGWPVHAWILLAVRSSRDKSWGAANAGSSWIPKSMERPLDPMQHTTPCSGAEGQSRTSRRKTYSRYLDHGTIFPELYIMGVGGRSNTSNSQSWQRLLQVFNFLINQGEKDQVSGADKVIHRRNSKSQQPWKKKKLILTQPTTGNEIIEQEWAILYLLAIPALGKSKTGRWLQEVPSQLDLCGVMVVINSAESGFT